MVRTWAIAVGLSIIVALSACDRCAAFNDGNPNPPPQIAGWRVSPTPNVKTENGQQPYDCGCMSAAQAIGFRIGTLTSASASPYDKDTNAGREWPDEEIHYRWRVYKKSGSQWPSSPTYTHTLNNVAFTFDPDDGKYGAAEGEYLIEWIAWDMGKHNGQYWPLKAVDWPSTSPGHGSFLVKVDGTAPTITITNPLASGEIHKAASQTTVQLTGTAADSGCGVTAVEVSVLSGHNAAKPNHPWNAATYSPSTQTWSWDWTNVQVGNYTLWASAADPAGNITEISLNVTVANDGVIYVDCYRDDDSGDGFSWATAKKTIQAGLNIASAGCQVWVRSGTYYESITLQDGVAMYGGFLGDETEIPSASLRKQSPSYIRATDEYFQPLDTTVVTIPTGAGRTTVIDGFYIAEGTGMVVGNARHGGGIYAPNASPTIRNNTVSDNTLATDDSYGAGIYCTGPIPVILNNEITDNSAYGNGTRGGGIYLQCSANTTGQVPIVANNVITYNHGADGGGIWAGLPSLRIINNTLYSNTCASDYYEPTGMGGGIYCSTGAVSIANNIVCWNTSGIYNGSATLTVGHNCVYDNWDPEYDYSWTPEPATDISEDPEIDWHWPYYKTQFASPCIDAGDDDAVESGWLDIEGLARVVDVPNKGSALVDIGAYEYVDTTAPGAPSVDDEDCTCSPSRLYATWAVGDSESGIAECQYAIGTSPSSLIVDWTSTGIQSASPNNYWVERTGLTLTPGNTYHLYVKAKNGMGLWSAVGSSNGVLVGCSSPTLEDALRCADGDILVGTIDNLLVLAGTSQFNAGGSYHMYVQDTVAGRINYNSYYNLRVDFENGTPTTCQPGDSVSIKGRMTTIGGERTMIIDLSDATNYHYSVTTGSQAPEPLQIDYVLGGLYYLCGQQQRIQQTDLVKITRPVVPEPAPYTRAFVGSLVSFPVVNADSKFQYVTYKSNPETGRKFIYVDDGTVRAHGRDAEDNPQPTDGNGLLDGDQCAEGVRVDYSWMADSLPSLDVGTGVRLTGISASTEITTKVEQQNEIVRLLRLRCAEDIEIGPTITSPEAGALVQSQYPTFTFTNPINGAHATHHTYINLAVIAEDPQTSTSEDYPPTSGVGGTYAVVESSENTVQWPETKSALQPGVDYYAFVRVSDDANAPVVDSAWSPWSKLGHSFRVSLDRLITPPDNSTIWDNTPLVSWRYDHTIEHNDVFMARISSDDNPAAPNDWANDNISGVGHVTCTTELSAGTHYVFLKKSNETDWEKHTITVHTDAAGAGQIQTGSASYTYDRFGNVETMVDWRGTTTYYYDGLNRLVKTHLTSSMQEWNGQEVIYKHGASLDKSGYDLRSNRTQMVTVSESPEFEHATEYECNDRGRLSRLTDQLGGVTSYTYYDRGQVQRITYPNGTYAHHQYNSRSWLTDLDNMKSDGTTVIAGFDYSYDTTYWGKSGMRTSVVENILKPDNTRIQSTVSYTYDDLYHLASEVRTGSLPYSKSYEYDVAGNRMRMVDGGMETLYTYDDANKMLTAGSTTFAYDGAGNTRTATTGSNVTTYTWGFRNLMTQWQSTGQTTVSFAYDGRGMRVSKIPDSGTATSFLLDGKEIAEEITGEDVASYVGPGLMSCIRGAVRTTYHTDGIGSTRATSNEGQVVQMAALYDAYGSPVAGYPTGSVSRFGYAGHYRYYRDDSGLDYLKARYYDPALGRFLSRDPIGFAGGLDLYAYVHNSPTHAVDPTGKITSCGLCAACIGAAAVGIVAGCADGCRGSACYWECFYSCLKYTFTDEFWADLPWYTQAALWLCKGACGSCIVKSIVKDPLPEPAPTPEPVPAPQPPPITYPGDPGWSGWEPSGPIVYPGGPGWPG